MADVIVHGQIVQHRELPVLQNADSVSGADPDPAVDVLDALDVHERRYLNDLGFRNLPCFGIEPDVMEIQVDALHVEHIRVLRIGEYGSGCSYRVVRDAYEPDQFPVLYENKITQVRSPVQDSVPAPSDVTHVGFGNLLVFHPEEIVVLIHIADAACGGDVDCSVGSLCNSADMGALQAVHFTPKAQRSLFHHSKTGIIGSYPKMITAVYVQALDTGHAAGGSDSLECVSVITDQTGEAADPNEAVTGLGYGVGLRCRQAVGVVVENSRKAVLATHRVN